MSSLLPQWGSSPSPFGEGGVGLLFAVMLGSALGGGLRYLVARWLALVAAGPWPWATLAVNVAGCFLIGLFSSLPSSHGWLSPTTRLLLTTGFCGGFTTFSTFAKETAALSSAHLPVMAIAYVALSLAAGLAAYWAGCRLA